jgi:alpha-tubulin suppressor-like RCC1 family protein
MGVYPNIELTLTYLESKMNILSVPFNQSYPRLVKNNLMFYKIKRIVCGPFNSALITEKGELLIQGTNDGGQLGLGNEIGKRVPFFPEFRKIENLGLKMPVIDVTMGAQSVHILAMA